MPRYATIYQYMLLCMCACCGLCCRLVVSEKKVGSRNLRVVVAKLFINVTTVIQEEK